MAVGLCFADLLLGLFFILLAAWELVLAAAGISFAGIAVRLFGGINVFGIIPPMPYWCGAVLALPFAPSFSGKAKRRLRSAALISLALFAACFALSYAACALSAGGFEFRHIRGWFSD